MRFPPTHTPPAKTPPEHTLPAQTSPEQTPPEQTPQEHNSADGDSALRLRHAGLRPTRQRVALADLLFAKGDRHLTAEELHEEAVDVGVACSLATVYNTLHQFTEAGLLRVLSLETARTYFDTNVSDHHHFVVEGTNDVLDIPIGNISVSDLPEAPDGMEITHVDVVIRVRAKR